MSDERCPTCGSNFSGVHRCIKCGLVRCNCYCGTFQPCSDPFHAPVSAESDLVSELEAALEKMTPEPWEFHGYCWAVAGFTFMLREGIGLTPDDAAGIVLLRNSARTLIDRLRKAEEERDALRKRVADQRSQLANLNSLHVAYCKTVRAMSLKTPELVKDAFKDSHINEVVFIGALTEAESENERLRGALQEAKMLMRAIVTYKDKDGWIEKIRGWLARNSSTTDILRESQEGSK